MRGAEYFEKCQYINQTLQLIWNPLSFWNPSTDTLKYSHVRNNSFRNFCSTRIKLYSCIIFSSLIISYMVSYWQTALRHILVVTMCSTVLHCTLLYCIVLYGTVLYCTVLYCTIRYCTVLYCTVLYITVLHCTVLYCIVHYCIVLYCLYCTYRSADGCSMWNKIQTSCYLQYPVAVILCIKTVTKQMLHL